MNKSEKVRLNKNKKEQAVQLSAAAGTLMLLSVVLTALLVFVRLIYGGSVSASVLAVCVLLFLVGLQMFYYAMKKRVHTKRQK